VNLNVTDLLLIIRYEPSLRFAARFVLSYPLLESDGFHRERGTMDWQDKSILITGGTGSFGKACARFLLDNLGPRKVIVYSRDEAKQYEMQHVLGFNDERIRYFIGDVRDKQRLSRAMSGVDIVVHSAAMKQVPACEYNPIEAVKTNIDGATNIIDVAIDQKVPKVIALSTDKAVSPVNLYGATKLVAEKLFVQGNTYAGAGVTRFSCTRYGNVVGSRGSVIPLFRKQRAKGVITVTDERMTRFWLTLDEAVRFVVRCVDLMQGGEVFVPKLPSMRLMDLAKTVAPECRVEVVGIRPGEKLDETLVSRDESRHTVVFDDMYIIEPSFPWWTERRLDIGTPMPPGTKFSSDENDRWTTMDELRSMIGDTGHDGSAGA
jgi:UDP-N-acetylglucosamine 4,6-dehydratase/5-epimerase